jgi:hypothetical protein
MSSFSPCVVEQQKEQKGWVSTQIYSLNSEFGTKKVIDVLSAWDDDQQHHKKKTHSQSEWSFLIQNCLDRCVVCSISHLAIKNPSTCGASNYSVLDSDSIDLKHKYLARHDNALHPTLGSKKEIIRISFRIN